ncbi:F0F1 ATP synthase subunit alpha [Allostreptomyces psammosilenae]|uniref:ATP synthase subunit alpha n=1 Tax=Allostreptomyces psammosilenae TaxID=1892865 RepID=A0A852ZW31_9ACTN|nr:F0F1 ATP synthase subunit alpha [Allostreptomyces psammosilenae]NYI06429.1 F-type H+-transporting ATPase subunit alpha [Allostreptomyces psammosilenae]
MAELTIRPDEIRDALERFVQAYEPDAAAREEVGTVTDCGDGIAHVEGLPSVMANELLKFEDGTLGLAQNLDTREIGVVILGDFSGIEEGQTVRRTGEILSVPVGDGYLGRVVDPLGNPIDGLGEIESTGRRALELQAPGVMARKSVHEPLQTGIKAIDALTPIGRGQRQLIIGDRQTGKTAVAVDTIINQVDNWRSGDPKKQVRCIYVAVGQKGSTIASVRGALEEAGALEFTTIVAAPASDPAGFKYLAPYTGSAIGQHWMYDGKHVLIVFDDLSKQAEAYRAVSLLLRRPPGREAYPGDVFYLHSRLLERCAKLSDEMGAGSMTGLPIVETKANDVSAYIPTNVISITDGQCFLESDLFNAGVRPAVNVGISVSRVGGSAQIKPMRQVAGRLRVDLAQYRELEAFAAFGSDLDPVSKAQLERGARMVELLKQGQYQPFPVEEQVVSLWAGGEGHLDDVPVAEIRRFERQFLDYLGQTRKDLLTGIAEAKDKLPSETIAALTEAIAEFKKGYETADGRLLGDASAAS